MPRSVMTDVERLARLRERRGRRRCRAWPPFAVTTAWPSASSVSRSDLSSSGSSSTSRMRRRRGHRPARRADSRRPRRSPAREASGASSCPCPARCRSRSRALCRCTMPYTIARPRPVPRSPLVVKNGSRQRRRVSSSMPTPVSVTSTQTTAASVAAADRDARAQRQRAALGHGIDGVEDEVGERVADLAFRADDRRQVRRELGPQLDHDAALLRHVAPARAREIEDLLRPAGSRSTGASVSCGSRWR